MFVFIMSAVVQPSPPRMLTTGVWSRPLGDSRVTRQDAAKAPGAAVNTEELPPRGRGKFPTFTGSKQDKKKIPPRVFVQL